MARLAVYLPALLIGTLLAAGAAAIATVEVAYLTHGVGASALLAGIVLGLAAIPLVVFAPFLRSMADRIGANAYLTWASLILACAAIAAPLLGSAELYLAPKLVFVLLLPLLPLLLEEVLIDTFHFSRNKDRLLLAAAIAAAAGSAAGALAAGTLATSAFGDAYIFAAACFVGAAFMSNLLPRTAHPRIPAKASLHLTARIDRVLTKRWRPLAIITAGVAAYFSLRDFAVPLMILSRGYSMAAVGLVIGLAGAGGIVGLLIAHRLLSRNKPGKVLALGLLVFAVAATLLPFGPLGIIAAISAISGSGASWRAPATQDEVYSSSSERAAPSILEGLFTLRALAWVAAPIIAGIIIQAGVPAGVLVFIAGAGSLYIYWRAKSEWSPEQYLPSMDVRRRRRW